VGAAGVRRTGQPAEPPDDGADDDDRQPHQRAVSEEAGANGREGDGGAVPGQFGPLAGQPGVGIRDAAGRRFPLRCIQGALTPDSSASTAATRPMAVMATARIWGSRERGSGCPWRSARWLAFHSV